MLLVFSLNRNNRDFSRQITNFKNLSHCHMYSFSVRGKVDGGNSDIFIKNVIDASPAGRSAGLFIGDLTRFSRDFSRQITT